MRRRRLALRRRYGLARAVIPRVAGPNPARMTAGEINRELDRLDRERGKINEAMIAAGRGHETWVETLAVHPTAADDLTLGFQAVAERQRDLRNEIRRRMGPGATSRLPKGFGPIKGW